MSDIEGLRARAEELGVKVDGRWGAGKLLQVISDAEGAGDGFGSTADFEAAYGDDLTDEDILDVANAAAAEVVAEMQPASPTDDGWPKRIAPCAWLDQDGNRWTDLGQAGEASERIRRR